MCTQLPSGTPSLYTDASCRGARDLADGGAVGAKAATAPVCLYKRGDTELIRAARGWPQPVGLAPGCGVDPTFAQNFENEPSFQFLSVSGPIKMYTPSSTSFRGRRAWALKPSFPYEPLEPTLQPLRHPLSHFPRLYSTNSPFGHPSLWPSHWADATRLW